MTKPPTPPRRPADETDVLIKGVGKIARLLQRSIESNDHSVVRGELLRLGTLSTPVVLELSSLLTELQREELTLHLCSALAIIQPPTKRASTSFYQLVKLWDDLTRKSPA